MSNSRIAAASVIGLVGALLGGMIGFIIARIAVEHFRIVEGPPAGVLLVLLIGVGAVLGGGLGLAWSLRRQRGRSVTLDE